VYCFLDTVYIITDVGFSSKFTPLNLTVHLFSWLFNFNGCLLFLVKVLNVNVWSWSADLGARSWSWSRPRDLGDMAGLGHFPLVGCRARWNISLTHGHSHAKPKPRHKDHATFDNRPHLCCAFWNQTKPSQVDSAFYPPWDGKMSTSQRAVMFCGWE